MYAHKDPIIMLYHCLMFSVFTILPYNISIVLHFNNVCRTAVNAQSGVKTPAAGIITGNLQCMCVYLRSSCRRRGKDNLILQYHIPTLVLPYFINIHIILE